MYLNNFSQYIFSLFNSETVSPHTKYHTSNSYYSNLHDKQNQLKSHNKKKKQVFFFFDKLRFYLSLVNLAVVGPRL